MSGVCTSEFLPRGQVLVMNGDTFRDLKLNLTVGFDKADGPDWTAWVYRRWFGDMPTHRHVIRPHQTIGRRAWATDWYRDPGSAWWEQ